MPQAREFGPSIRLILKLADMQLAQLKREFLRLPFDAAYGEAYLRIEAETKELQCLRDQSEAAFRGQLTCPEANV